MSCLKPRLLFGAIALAGLAAGMSAHAAQWFTLFGEVDNPRSDYIQIDLDSVAGDALRRSIQVRVSRAAPRTTKEGIVFRSFEAPTAVDCVKREAHFIAAAFYTDPHFAGEPFRKEIFASNDIRPMAFREIKGDPTQRIIRAACEKKSVQTVTN